MIPWIARPDQTEPLLRAWANRCPEWARLEAVRLWSHHACALTVTDQKLPDESRKRCLVTVPHAHEPAGTVACMNVLSELMEGRQLDGSRSTLDREALLRRGLFSFIPDGNPEGRARSPAAAWDGSQYTNDEFLMIAFGRDTRTGERFKRVDRWHTAGRDSPPGTDSSPGRDFAPLDRADPVGIVYERIDETTYVEPNRDWESSFFRLVRMLTGQRRYDRFLDLHQTEFDGSPYNCEVLLPVVWDELPGAIREATRPWADAITEAWRAIPGAHPHEPYPLGYTGQQRAYFEQRWGDLYRSVPCVTVEIQNNNPRTPPDLQRQLSETAIHVTLDWVLTG